MRSRFLIALAGILAWSLPAIAQQPGAASNNVQPAQAIELTAPQRSQIAETIIAKWSGQVMKSPGGDVKAWASKLRQVVATGDATNVVKASTMPSLQLTLAALVGAAIDDAALAAAVTGTASASTPMALGSVLADTTYTPLPYGRCRVASSLAINDPLPAGVVRVISTESIMSYSGQGGTGSSNGDGSIKCGIPVFATALAISASSRSPVANGVLKIFPANKTNAAGNTILFSVAGGGGGADLIVESCQACTGEIAIHATAQTHYIIDVIGYFMPPQATALECQDGPANTNALLAGASGATSSASCQIGFTETGTECLSFNPLITIHGASGGICYWSNNGTTTATLLANRRCCRVPGR